MQLRNIINIILYFRSPSTQPHPSDPTPQLFLLNTRRNIAGYDRRQQTRALSMRRYVSVDFKLTKLVIMRLPIFFKMPTTTTAKPRGLCQSTKYTICAWRLHRCAFKFFSWSNPRLQERDWHITNIILRLLNQTDFYRRMKKINITWSITWHMALGI